MSGDDVCRSAVDPSHNYHCCCYYFLLVDRTRCMPGRIAVSLQQTGSRKEITKHV